MREALIISNGDEGITNPFTELNIRQLLKYWKNNTESL